MSKTLVIRTSMIKKDISFSNELTDRFVKYLKEANPNEEIIEMDLNDVHMAQISLNRSNMDTFFNEKDSDYYINQLKEVNKIVFSCPMTNFNVCATAKNYLDHILVANKTFSYKYVQKGDAIGLLPHLKVQLLTTQGAPYGWYPWGNHTANLKGTWEFVGAKVVEPILIDGTKLNIEINKSPKTRIDECDEKIKKAAYEFAALPSEDWKSPI